MCYITILIKEYTKEGMFPCIFNGYFLVTKIYETWPTKNRVNLDSPFSRITIKYQHEGAQI